MKPLHYKRLVTKRKIHIAYNNIFIVLAILFIIAFLFFRQEKFIHVNECLAVYILQNLFYLLTVMLLFAVFITMMLTSYIIVTIKLKQRTGQFGSEISNNRTDMNFKIIKASWLALSAFLILYTPPILLTLGSNFLEHPYPIYYLVVQDICTLMYFINNVINPFLYYRTLSNFRQGYQRLLSCGKSGGNNGGNQVNLSSNCISAQRTIYTLNSNF